MQNNTMQNNTTGNFARVINMQRTSPCDWHPRTYGKMREAEANEVLVEVLRVAVEVDDVFEHNYHDVRLPDGTILHAISGLHLAQVRV